MITWRRSLPYSWYLSGIAVSGAPTKGAPAQDSDSSAGATSRRRSTRTPPRSRGTPTRQPHDDKVVTYAEVKICMKDCVRDLVSSTEFRQLFDEAAVSGVSRINKSTIENLTKTSKEVVDAAKLAGVNLLSTSIQKPLAKHSKVRHASHLVSNLCSTREEVIWSFIWRSHWQPLPRMP